MNMLGVPKYTVNKYLPSSVGKMHLSFYSVQRGCDDPSCRWWWWATCHALWTPHACTHPKPSAYQASTISSSHQLVASSRHQYGRQIALARSTILSASYISISCIVRVEGCTTTARQARCYVLRSCYRMLLASSNHGKWVLMLPHCAAFAGCLNLPSFL
jgi:hypothetical protein